MFDYCRKRLHINSDEKTTEMVLISRLLKNVHRMYDRHFGHYYDYQKFTTEEKRITLYRSLINIYNLVHISVLCLGFDPDRFVENAKEKINSKKEEFERKDLIFKKCETCEHQTKDPKGNFYCIKKKEYLMNINSVDDC